MSDVNASLVSITGRGYGTDSHADVPCRVYSASGAAVDGPARGQRVAYPSTDTNFTYTEQHA